MAFALEKGLVKHVPYIDPHRMHHVEADTETAGNLVVTQITLQEAQRLGDCPECVEGEARATSCEVVAPQGSCSDK